MTEKTATEAAMQELDKSRDEREVHQRMKWFVDKWSERLDAGRDEQAELTADLTLLLQAVHRDANRETHQLLKNAIAVMPTQPIFVADKKGTKDVASN